MPSWRAATAAGRVLEVSGQGERTGRQEVECARRGKHLPPDGSSESGWVICGHCGIPLKRPDGGPVARPDGGPLGPDARQEDS
jgi:hypothetical protein